MVDQEMLPSRAGRIVLRRLEISDLDEFQAYRNDPEVARFQGWETLSDNEAQAFLADVATGVLLEPGHWSQIAITLASTGALIGDLGLYVSADGAEGEIGVSLNRDSQGQGLAAEAVAEAIRLIFLHTAVGRIVGITDIRNLPSMSLLQRVGMRKTGEQESIVKDETCSEFIYAITRAEAAGRQS